jgi:RNA polymerase sigma factor (sigma-70 family)
MLLLSAVSSPQLGKITTYLLVQFSESRSGEAPLLPIDSSAEFVSGLIGRLPTPSQELAKAELAAKLRLALGQLDTDDRDLILWRHFEQLTARDTAMLLDITEAAANKRHIRAVERLRKHLLDLGITQPAR